MEGLSAGCAGDGSHDYGLAAAIAMRRMLGRSPNGSNAGSLPHPACDPGRAPANVAALRHEVKYRVVDRLIGNPGPCGATFGCEEISGRAPCGFDAK